VQGSTDRGESLDAAAAAAKAGDSDAFGRLVVATSPGVYALALRLVGDEHDAADVLQETYLRAFKSIGQFRGESAVTTWLYRIAANCSSTQLRGRSRRRHAQLDDAQPACERAARDLDEVVGASSDRARLQAALSALPPTLRSVVVLSDVYDLGHEAIAAELGITRTASKVRLHRGRAKLREMLFTDQGELRLRGHRPVADADARGRVGPGHAQAM
jgi:RNA polymerase sigma-70 factor (ECF subfamily)